MSTLRARIHVSPRARLNALAWFGVLAGPAAWALQFLFSMQFGLARCESPNGRFPFPVHVLSPVLGGIGAIIGLMAELAAIDVFRATRQPQGSTGRPKVTLERLHFLGAVGMTVNPLTVTICVMTSIGVPLLSICHQS
jgi:hypothetical protein